MSSKAPCPEAFTTASKRSNIPDYALKLGDKEYTLHTDQPIKPDQVEGIVSGFAKEHAAKPKAAPLSGRSPDSPQAAPQRGATPKRQGLVPNSSTTLQQQAKAEIDKNIQYHEQEAARLRSEGHEAKTRLDTASHLLVDRMNPVGAAKAMRLSDLNPLTAMREVTAPIQQQLGRLLGSLNRHSGTAHSSPLQMEIERQSAHLSPQQQGQAQDPRGLLHNIDPDATRRLDAPSPGGKGFAKGLIKGGMGLATVDNALLALGLHGQGPILSKAVTGYFGKEVAQGALSGVKRFHDSGGKDTEALGEAAFLSTLGAMMAHESIVKPLAEGVKVNSIAGKVVDRPTPANAAFLDRIAKAMRVDPIKLKRAYQAKLKIATGNGHFTPEAVKARSELAQAKPKTEAVETAAKKPSVAPDRAAQVARRAALRRAPTKPTEAPKGETVATKQIVQQESPPVEHKGNDKGGPQAKPGRSRSVQPAAEVPKAETKAAVAEPPVKPEPKPAAPLQPPVRPPKAPAAAPTPEGFRSWIDKQPQGKVYTKASDLYQAWKMEHPKATREEFGQLLQHIATSPGREIVTPSANLPESGVFTFKDSTGIERRVAGVRPKAAETPKPSDPVKLTAKEANTLGAHHDNGNVFGDKLTAAEKPVPLTKPQADAMRRLVEEKKLDKKQFPSLYPEAKTRAAPVKPAVAEPAATPSPEPKPPSHSTEYGAENKGITQSDYKAAFEAVQKSLGKLSAGIDPTLLPHLIKMGAFHLEAGARQFASWAKQMKADLGEKFPEDHLKEIWAQIQPKPAEHAPAPGADTDGGDFTGARNKITEQERANRAGGLSEAERQNYIKVGDAYLLGKKAIEERGVDHNALAESVANKPRVLSAEEVGTLAHGRHLLKQRYDSLGAQMDKAIASGDKVAVANLRAEILEIERQYDLNDQALVKGGREQSAAFAARRMVIYDDGNIMDVMKAGERRKGAPLSKLERAQFEKLTKEHAEKVAEVERLHAEIAERDAQKAVDNLARIAGQAKRAGRLKDLSTERKSLIQSLREAIKPRLSAGPGQAVEVSIVLGKLAINYIKEGATRLEDVVAKVREDFPEFTARHIHDALSGYGRPGPKPADEVQKKIAELKKEAKLTSQTEDEPGKDTRVPPKPSETDNPHIVSMRSELGEYHKQRARQEEIAALEKRIAAGDIERKGGKKDQPKSADETKLAALKKEYAAKQADLDRLDDLRNQIDREREGIDTRKPAGEKRKPLEGEEALRDERDKLRGARDTAGKVEDLTGKLNRGEVEPKATPKDRPLTEAETRLKELEAEYRRRQAALTRTDDLKGQLEHEKAGVDTRQRQPTREQGAEEKRIRQEIANERNLRDINAEIARLEGEYQKGIYREPMKREAQADPRLQAAIQRRLLAKQKIRSAVQAMQPKTGLDRIVEVGRAMKLASVAVFAKLGGASVWAMPVETLGNALSYPFGRLEVKGVPLYRIAEREGRFSLGTEGRSYKRFVSREALQNAKDTFKEGYNSIHAQAQAELHDNDFLSLPGRTHGFAKSFLQTAEFGKSFEYRMEAAAEAAKRAGEEFNPNDPETIAKIGYGAALDAQMAILQGPNVISTMLTRSFDAIERAGTGKGPIAEPAAKVTAAFLRSLVPIAKVPANYLGKTVQMTGAGLLEGAYRQAKAERSVKPLTSAEADNIIRAYKNGGLGLVAAVIGLTQPAFFKSAGFFPSYRKGTKPNKDNQGKEMNPSELQIMGVRIPHQVAHSPFLESIQFWATVRRALDQHSATGLGEAAKGVIQQAPGLESLVGMGNAAVGEGYDPSGTMGDYVRGIVEPQAINELAKYQDIGPAGIPNQRKSTGFGAKFMAGTPEIYGLPQLPSRKKLPLKAKGGAKRASHGSARPRAIIP